MQKTTTFLMFVNDRAGKAEEAITFYTSLFKNSAILNIDRYSADSPVAKKGMVRMARFTLDGQEYMASENTMEHKFGFTPAISIYVRCENESELDSLFSKLSEGGSVMMPPGNYGFSKRFAWAGDRYGVSWQIDVRDQEAITSCPPTSPSSAA